VSTAAVAAVTNAASSPLPVRAAISASRQAPSQPVCIIREKVITAELLAARVQGVRRVQVQPRAVLTPSARDYLRQHALECLREAGAAGARLSWQIVVSQSPPHLNTALETLRKEGFAFTRQLAGTPVEVVREITTAVCRAEVAGAVVVTGQPDMVACLANRQPRLRAGVAGDVASVTRLQNDLGANVLALNPAGRSFSDLRNILRAYLGTAPNVPAGWQEPSVH